MSVGAGLVDGAALVVGVQRDRSRLQVLYTDASTDGPTGLRLGLWLVAQDEPARIASFDVPADVIASWRLRRTYIGQGELLAVPVALVVLGEFLRGHMCTWYIDNTSAASAAVKGASPEADNAPLALIGALLATGLSVRLWVEYVPSAQNPADVMTHRAYEDAEVQRQLAAGTAIAAQMQFDWAPLCSLEGAMSVLQRWG